MDRLDQIYMQMKGSKVRDSRIVIPGFSEQDYEDLLDLLLETLIDMGKIGGDYYEWIAKKARSYHQFRVANRVYADFYDPLIDQKPYELTTRQQLAILKYFLYRYTYSVAMRNAGEQRV